MILAQNEVHVASNADVGIGTDTPSDKIHVFESTLPYIRVSNNTTGLSSGLRMGINGPGDAWIYTLGVNKMNLGTNGASRILINSIGDVGIGTISPYTKLTMGGTIGFLNSVGSMMYIFQNGTNNADKGLLVHSPSFTDYGMFYNDSIDNIYLKGGGIGQEIWFDLFQGNIGVNYKDSYNDIIMAGTSGTAMSVLRIGHSGNGTYSNNENTGAIIFDEFIDLHTDVQEFCGVALKMNGDANDLEFHGGCNVNFSNSTLIMAMDRGGSIGIGVAPTSTYKLQVAGKVRSEEVVVETGWADYVFHADYELMSLQEVEMFIESRKHLPGVPSAQIVESEGLHVGAMSEVFMRKIEELTLYTIDQEKKLVGQDASISALQESNISMKNQLENQQQQIQQLLKLTKTLSREIELRKEHVSTN
ncbi:MAG: hypothetical protein DRI69_08665 [Bacteroidetes bacterium]|nr:MAG: hypothetical protein DRI69_08665 [Bacteroidota bacterium]